MIRVYISGRHSKRLPLSYRALAPLFAGRIEAAASPAEADLYLFAHSLDIQAAPQALVQDWRRRRQRPVVLLSEEPFWDTIWGRQPLQRQLILATAWGDLPVIQLNHATSGLFRFARIPYYLLTNHRFANTYAARFARNAQLGAADWQARFAARQTDLTFMFERRPEPYHAVQWPEADIAGLCSWRTELAEAAHWPRTERLGRSWQGGQARQQLRNWHLDKITRLDGRCRLMAAFENTHQPDYLTEKLFDAFACGALPLYWAAPGHRLHSFGLPPQAWVNCHGLTPQQAAAQLQALLAADWPAERFEAYAQAQRQLADLFAATGLWVAERQRLQAAMLEEFTAILDGCTALSA